MLNTKEKILTVRRAAILLKISQQNVLEKAKRLGILKWSEEWEKHFLFEKDLKHFTVDYRQKRELAKYPKKYKVKKRSSHEDEEAKKEKENEP